MRFAPRLRVQLLGGRFIESNGAVVDLATVAPVAFRRLPPCPPRDERLWAEACAGLLRVWHEDLPPLLDYGFTSEGRFEAYSGLRSRPLSADACKAVSAFLANSRPGERTARRPVHLGMRLVVPAALVALGEVLEDGCPGRPLSIVCLAEPGAGATTFLRLAASLARVHGYVPVGVAAFEQWPDLHTWLRDRSIVLLCDADDSSRRAEQRFFRLGVASTGSHVLLRVTNSVLPAADVTLRLAAIDPDLLAERVHMYPETAERRVRAAARNSGGLPGRFVARLREASRAGTSQALRVAEAHAAYSSQDKPPHDEVDHPWRDLIAGALRLAEAGRRAAAERDLRQIAAAAERRHMAAAAGTAQVELAGLLLERGRTAEAGDLFRTRALQHADQERLTTRAALGLGFVHLLHGDLEAAESTFRVCRAAAPAEAAVGLGWTLLVQGRDFEAERAIIPAHESSNGRSRVRAGTVTAAIAFVRQDLPGASRAATQAMASSSGDRITEALAAMLLAILHGRICDPESVQQYSHRAVAAARAARMPLLVFGTRAAGIEAQHACGVTPARLELERLLRAAERIAPLVRATLLSVAARAHPAEQRRAELSQKLESVVRTTGARALIAAAWEAAGVAVENDAAALVTIYESCPTPAETLKRTVEWLRGRVNARSVLVCDSTGAPLARAGAQDAISAARRVLQTRVAQPPWASADGLESAVVVRYANAVQGALACRWPLSRMVPGKVVSTMATAGSILGPAIALMAERAVTQPAATDGIVGRSAGIVRLREQITRAGTAPFPVLIEGESGAGKELVARGIHRESPRRLRACVAINCAALSDDLFEAEVFGHARGAFTGAHVERAGLFEQADGGTMFLDEVSELSTRAQAKLLRTLQEGEVRRIGENHSRRVDVRVIAASNRRLEEEVAAGRFRRDLLFRLAVIRIPVPPLRERREDIPLLAAHYWENAARRTGARSVLSKGALSRLALYDWPGNVRELQNVIAALAVQVPRGRVGAEQVAALIGSATPFDAPSAEPAIGSLDDARRAFEREFIGAALARCGGRHGAAARQLGISRQGLAKLMKRLEMGQ